MLEAHAVPAPASPETAGRQAGWDMRDIGTIADSGVAHRVTVLWDWHLCQGIWPWSNGRARGAGLSAEWAWTWSD